ncbi:MAG: hypothetical protein U0228_36745 [Myxococcaceae bacterium]
MRLLLLVSALALPALGDEGSSPTVVTTEAAPPRNGVSLAAGGAVMANLHNELRVGATDVELAYRHDFAWSTFEVGAEFMSFFNARGADPAVGLRIGWGVRFTVGPVQLRAGLSAGGYWTHAAPVVPVGCLDLGVEKRLGASSEWVLGGSVSGLYSLFGAGAQARLTLARMF